MSPFKISRKKGLHLYLPQRQTGRRATTLQAPSALRLDCLTTSCRSRSPVLFAPPVSQVGSALDTELLREEHPEALRLGRKKDSEAGHWLVLGRECERREFWIVSQRCRRRRKGNTEQAEPRHPLVLVMCPAVQRAAITAKIISCKEGRFAT